MRISSYFRCYLFTAAYTLRTTHVICSVINLGLKVVGFYQVLVTQITIVNQRYNYKYTHIKRCVFTCIARCVFIKMTIGRFEMRY